jgi:hypothetical protein
MPGKPEPAALRERVTVLETEIAALRAAVTSLQIQAAHACPAAGTAQPPPGAWQQPGWPGFSGTIPDTTCAAGPQWFP